MNLKEVKTRILALLEEFSESDLSKSDDEDINKKLNPLIDMAQKHQANIFKIRKMKQFDISSSEESGYTPYSLGIRCYQLESVKLIEGKDLDYYFFNRKIYVKNDFNGIIQVFYNIFPETITEITEDISELEVDNNAQMMICYEVAGDILKSDVSANYAAFDNKYQALLQTIDYEKDNTIGVVRKVKRLGI